ncbi:MAG: amidohydrolase family protein, partial [Pseudomonadales bacterium]
MNGVAHLFTLLVLTFGFVVTGCDQSEREPAADWVFEGGKVFTAEPDAPWAEAVAVKGGQIVYVGSSDGVQDLIGAETQVVDVGPGLLIPGLMDSHTHIFNGSFADVGVNLSLADTAEKLAAALETIRDDNPGTAPVYARGWQNHLFPAHGPLASQLDEVFGDRIVILGSVDG